MAYAQCLCPLCCCDFSLFPALGKVIYRKNITFSCRLFSFFFCPFFSSGCLFMEFSFVFFSYFHLGFSRDINLFLGFCDFYVNTKDSKLQRNCQQCIFTFFATSAKQQIPVNKEKYLWSICKPLTPVYFTK